MLTGSFSAKAYSFFDTLLWIACLNLLWIVFSLAGLGVFGVGPATAAAQVLVRRRVRGEAAPLPRSFAREYGRNFGRGNGLALPVLLAGAALALNWNYFSRSADLPSQLLAAGTFAGAIFLVAVACHLFPLFARYELPLAQYLLMSSRFALRHLAGTAILLFVTAAAYFASQSLPGLIPFFSIGAWLYATGWLCDRFFTANDESVTGPAVDTDARARSDARSDAGSADRAHGPLNETYQSAS
ncbi:YesL family protein [Arthrobacter sp. B10-11]|uniref:YesL family protein n=1 Tax=Arthrobacter sp. B10-11 TaxID=3081160 RepID=UPI002955821D|nr:DUF624 domain-containing protein [Arthrobacter sp. B10-11]MDV8147104.1 DUF624 domain-containing protein [Arthrobacter sp. B10-11]